MSNDIILKVENVSKLYRLGTVGTGTFRGDVHRFWKTKVLGQEDPFLKIGQTNDRTSKEKSEFVWALKDINFEVKRGEVLGIIGKNGAGKSTLLKLLSRITSPTTGTIKSAGRMASLLEVGTGFHPELTGRENIYLNGAILGMTKREIQSKFDEIVDFSGCELYIETPVKRYSSGMTVRLGFAVAAFLDPEILVVDEVLAVGDAEFQKKAIGKMKEVSEGGGRTVLFVSHNLNSIKVLCEQTILLKHGMVETIGETNAVIQNYLKQEDTVRVEFPIITDTITINSISLDSPELDVIKQSKPIRIVLDYEVNQGFFSKSINGLGFCILINSSSGELVSSMNTYHCQDENLIKPEIGTFQIVLEVSGGILNDGEYTLDLNANDLFGTMFFKQKNIISFVVLDDHFRRGSFYSGSWPGQVSIIPKIFVKC
jgi:lipopolysaccharide transport system ATP-binding protein